VVMNFCLGLCPEAHHACEAGKLDKQAVGPLQLLIWHKVRRSLYAMNETEELNRVTGVCCCLSLVTKFNH
jgi:hypothetical protein